MARKRKTADEKRAEWAEAEHRVWVYFKEDLEAAAGFAEAQALTLKTPAQGAPGRGYYSNLAFFLREFAVPAGSNQKERTMYLNLVRRIDAARQLKPGVRERLERELRAN